MYIEHFDILCIVTYVFWSPVFQFELGYKIKISQLVDQNVLTLSLADTFLKERRYCCWA